MSSVEADLLKLPGVTGVDIGPKIVKGKKTNVMAIRVYVKKKRKVPGAIPKEIEGVPTDVIDDFRLALAPRTKTLDQ